MRMRSRRVAAEAIGTAMLLAAVVGSGIMGERLAGGNVAIALLANTLATGAALVALILTFGPISGAHFNPVVTLAELLRRRIERMDAAAYVAAQIVGAFLGVVCAHLMFGEPLVSASTHERSGFAQGLSEVVATFGLVSVILGCAKSQPRAVPFAVGAYIAAAYWFTASTSFANPAVTFARAATDTFAGVRPADVPMFVAAQLLGASLATGLFRWLEGSPPLNTVIFACVHSAGRSQMAAAFFAQLANPALARAVSAGTQPAERVHPEVVASMGEVGIDLSQARPRLLTPELARDAQWLITMGCGDDCPVLPGVHREDWPLPDPKGRSVDEVRAIRSEIRERVWKLIAQHGWWKLRPPGEERG